MIELRNNLHISIETEVRTENTYRHNPDFAESAIPLLRVYEVFIESILLTIVLIHLVTFHLMIYDIKSHH